MKKEQKLVMIYTVLGVLCGLLSNYMVSSLPFALMLPAVIYFVSLFLLMKISKESKLKMVISNTLITFFAVWITVWVFLYNL